MNHELIYLLLICGLLIVPRALQRFRVPAPLTCFLFGIGLMLAWPSAQHHNDAVHLLATLGISSLFLYAGLEVDLAQLRQGLRPLLTYLVLRALMLGAVGWAAWRLFGLPWQAATLVALALLTSPASSSIRWTVSTCAPRIASGSPTRRSAASCWRWP